MRNNRVWSADDIVVSREDKIVRLNVIESKVSHIEENQDRNKILVGDCIEMMRKIESKSVNLVFADPPYNLQLSGTVLSRPNSSVVNGVTDEWDKFDSFREYDEFTRSWLSEVRRVMDDDATIFVIGSYHNIFRVGAIMQDMGFWILNDIVWRKTNPMPNFRGTRFQNAHETMIWASKNQKSHYTFNYKSLKNGNEDIQVRSDWEMPICIGEERLKHESGEKVHPTQKPEALLKRVILSASKMNDVVLDPFFGTGTTGAVAKMLRRSFIGIERDENYVRFARKRIDEVSVLDEILLDVVECKTNEVRIPFTKIIEEGYVSIGGKLYDQKGNNEAIIRVDGSVQCGVVSGSIHKVGSIIGKMSSCNGWNFWHVMDGRGNLVELDAYRKKVRENIKNHNVSSGRSDVA